jgi:LPXTG-motif cell wall-anchored protein
MVGDDLKHQCKCSHGYIGAACETRSELIKVSDTATEITLTVMLVVLAAALVLLLRRKRKKNIPDFVMVQQQAMKKQLKQMPHVSYNDEPLQVQEHVGPFGNESKLNAVI